MTSLQLGNVDHDTKRQQAKLISGMALVARRSDRTLGILDHQSFNIKKIEMITQIIRAKKRGTCH